MRVFAETVVKLSIRAIVTCEDLTGAGGLAPRSLMRFFARDFRSCHMGLSVRLPLTLLPQNK